MKTANSESNADSSFEINHADLSYERLDGETIVISLKDGFYYSFSGPAADLWWLIQEGRSTSAIIEDLSKVFQLPTHDIGELGIKRFIEQALERNLIRRVDQSIPSPKLLPSDYPREAWFPPIFTEFSELKDLILVDPIHDTTALGWPMLREE